MLIASAPVMALTKLQASDGRSLDPNTQFYVAKPNHGAIEQIASLTSSGDKASAALIREMIDTPQAVWFTSGSPHGVQQDVKNTVKLAAAKGTVPVLVAYNLPFRDCSQYSAGGAASKAEYEAWIDGFAAGIGDAKAVVILEPDGLGIIPWYKQFRGLPSESASYEWCQPAEADQATAANDRFAMLNHAVDALKAKPNVSVYLDGTHSGWLGSGDAAHRLVQAGVQRVDGFFLNV
jgi:endoglucanase